MRASQERLLADKDIRVKRWLKMLRFKDTEGNDAFEIDDFCANLHPNRVPDDLATQALGDGMRHKK